MKKIPIQFSTTVMSKRIHQIRPARKVLDEWDGESIARGEASKLWWLCLTDTEREEISTISPDQIFALGFMAARSSAR